MNTSCSSGAQEQILASLSLANFCKSFVKITQIIGNFGVFARLAGGDSVAELPLCDREALLESLERRPLRGTSSFFFSRRAGAAPCGEFDGELWATE